MVPENNPKENTSGVRSRRCRSKSLHEFRRNSLPVDVIDLTRDDDFFINTSNAYLNMNMNSYRFAEAALDINVPSNNQVFLNKNSFSRAEVLSAQEYVKEVKVLQNSPAPEFSRFYKFITHTQIRNGKAPISFQTFLEFFNRGALVEQLNEYRIYLSKKLNQNFDESLS